MVNAASGAMMVLGVIFPLVGAIMKQILLAVRGVLD